MIGLRIVFIHETRNPFQLQNSHVWWNCGFCEINQTANDVYDCVVSYFSVCLPELISGELNACNGTLCCQLSINEYSLRCISSKCGYDVRIIKWSCCAVARTKQHVPMNSVSNKYAHKWKDHILVCTSIRMRSEQQLLIFLFMRSYDTHRPNTSHCMKTNDTENNNKI